MKYKKDAAVSERQVIAPIELLYFRIAAKLLTFRNNLLLNLCFTLASILLFAPALGPVPSSNENIYLLDLARVWDPTLLPSDWTWAPPLYSHRAFSFVFGILSLGFSLEVVGWLGRVASWALTLIALFRIGGQLNLARWMTSAAIFLWLLYQQALVGGEFALGTFEAKSIAYVFLFFGLSFLLEDRDFLGALCLGLSFTFHGVIGMWALLAVGLTVMSLRYSLARLTKMAGGVLLTAIPGVIVIWPTISGDWQITAEQAKYLALVAAPFHLDPLSFPKRDVFLLLILFCFNCVYYRSWINDKKLRFINCFLIFLGVFALLGVVARVTEHYRFLFYFPFRLFPLLVPLFFFFNLLRASRERELGRAKLVLGMCALLAFPGAVGQLIDQTKLHYWMWSTYYDWDDLQKSFIWVSQHTPKDATIILPPWRKESYYLTKRATVAHWALPRFDRFEEWQERIKALIGEFQFEDESLARKWSDHYHHLPAPKIMAIKSKYGGDFLISEGDYDYPTLFRSGKYKVYSLTLEREPTIQTRAHKGVK